MPSTGSRCLAMWNRGEEGPVGRMRWGGAPGLDHTLGSRHCASPSALSIFQGDRVPLNVELSRASHSGSWDLLEYGEHYSGCRICHLISLSDP